LSEKVKGRDHVEDLGVDLMKFGWEGVEWMRGAQDRDHWRALVSTVMNLQVA